MVKALPSDSCVARDTLTFMMVDDETPSVNDNPDNARSTSLGLAAAEMGSDKAP